mmetsp:Transcript_18280/g.25684  ORF Transcript_18280/g.25684 Transcript_18280/m.25684 type:complete len:207 (-) Transcript_18280:839-1459(-)
MKMNHVCSRRKVVENDFNFGGSSRSFRNVDNWDVIKAVLPFALVQGNFGVLPWTRGVSFVAVLVKIHVPPAFGHRSVFRPVVHRPSQTHVDRVADVWFRKGMLGLVRLSHKPAFAICQVELDAANRFGVSTTPCAFWRPARRNSERAFILEESMELTLWNYGETGRDEVTFSKGAGIVVACLHVISPAGLICADNHINPFAKVQIE